MPEQGAVTAACQGQIGGGGLLASVGSYRPDGVKRGTPAIECGDLSQTGVGELDAGKRPGVQMPAQLVDRDRLHIRRTRFEVRLTVRGGLSHSARAGPPGPGRR